MGLYSLRLLAICLFFSVCVFLSHNAADGAQPFTQETTDVSHPTGMTIGQSVVLGLVEGITEYLPVSSTGHLLFAQRIMGIGLSSADDEMQKELAKTAADAYAICIQAGAILAVLGLYARRVRQMIKGLFGQDPAGLQMVVNIVAGFLPAAILGLLFADIIKTYLFGPWPVVAAWFVGGVAILFVSWRRRALGRTPKSGISLDALTWKMALGIGIAQCIAMWPGVSRSLITIVGGVLAGLSLPAAVEFSFLLGVVTLGAATCYDGLKHGETMLAIYDPLTLFVGLFVAFLSAVLAVKWMVAYLNRHGLSIFGYYRVMVSILAGIVLSMGMI